MNLGDPDLELVDPTPNVHSLFIHFDKIFFWSKLASRAAVRWSKRMYSCAGTCSYECRAGFCDIALSEPLLKLRSRKDLIETLLHEMIHAFLFVTGRDRDRDGHGPNFQSHMFRINKLAGVNITIYHDFHDEVKLYQTHWWRCNGPCQNKRPYFGMVRRSANRAPGPNDFWWKSHQKHCGGIFVKVKEPEKACPKKQAKSCGDITKYIVNSNNKIVNSKNTPPKPKNITKGVLKDINNVSSIFEKAKNTKNYINGHIQQVKNIKNQDKTLSPILNDKNKVQENRKRTQTIDVAEVVRNVWANKQLPSMDTSNTITNKNNDGLDTSSDIIKPIKHKSEDAHRKSPLNKIRKIDNNFIESAKKILKDVYGSDFEIKLSDKDKLVPVKVNLVDCPICSRKIKDDEINRHLDECLNRDVIEELSKDSKPIEMKSSVTTVNKVNGKKLENTRKSLLTPKSRDDESNFKHVKFKTEMIDDVQDLSNKKASGAMNKPVSPKEKQVDRSIDNFKFKEKDINKVKVMSKNKNLRRSSNNVEKVTKSGDGPLPWEESTKINISPANEVDPGTSEDVLSDSTGQTCPCCDGKIAKSIEEHLDECLAFADDEGGASTSFVDTIVIEDDDVFDETLTLNSTGTKNPCPCCLKMIEQDEINDHLDICLAA